MQIIRRALVALLIFVPLFADGDPKEIARWRRQAQRVTIVRDDWGIAHVYGKTDADAVFGALYAQAEDDFNRVETNYLNAMGRLAEAEGEAAAIQDLRMKLFVTPGALQAHYKESPAWLQALMNAFADGLNFYLYKHPGVHPRVIRRFEPWMALSFTEGSIGGDIERVNLTALEAFYSATRTARAELPDSDLHEPDPTGSNGIAIAPSNTGGHRALLLINPHTSFFFRSELQMVSRQGLNAYGASTWGQFFIYQGFNDRAGWMHTSSGVDVIDEYLETVEWREGKPFYKYGAEWRPVAAREIVVPYKAGGSRKFTAYFTHHGPVIREENGKWVAVRLMQEPVKALTESYTRTKAKNYQEYLETMQLKANSSNNTIYADSSGTIAYFHGNFIPRRDTAFDWTKPVDGSNPATEWKGLLAVEETPHLVNPSSGWLYNTNNSPWSAAGAASPVKSAFPAYVESGTENARGLHAIRLLSGRKDFTLDSLIASAYDSFLPWFERTVPALLKAWDSTAPFEPLKARLSDPIGALRKWDYRWSADSTATTLAVFWGEEIRRSAAPAARKAGVPVDDYITQLPATQMLAALDAAVTRIAAGFGKWSVAWGEVNRFQRLTGDLVQPFNDAQPSIPVAFTAGTWGSLASFGARPYSGTQKWYGTSGNSFVAAVEFGPKVRAKAVSAGGENGVPSSKHFNDQAGRYTTGQLRDVYFYRDELKGHIERQYHPGL